MARDTSFGKGNTLSRAQGNWALVGFCCALVNPIFSLLETSTYAGILKRKTGQAAIETGLALPFLIWLLYYTINAFHALHTSHVGQKYAAMNVYERLDNRAKFIVDEIAGTVYTSDYLAVQYQDENGDIPERRILLESKEPTRMLNIIGICREPGCR